MQSRIKEKRQNLINGVILQLQKEKEDNIQEGHQKIHEEVELNLEDVHAKYDGIISKARVIKDQAKRIEDTIVSEKKIDEMHVCETISTPSLPGKISRKRIRSISTLSKNKMEYLSIFI
jgi:hypothetical protein